jgi:hypothetical protein
MKHGNDFRIVPITPPAAKVDNAAFTTAAIDTCPDGNKYDQCDIFLYIGDLDIAVAAAKVQESESSDMSNPADVTGAVGGAGFTLPGAGDDNKISRISLDLRKRKRYLDLVITGGDGSTGAYATFWAVLSRPHISPNSAAERGVTGFECIV